MAEMQCIVNLLSSASPRNDTCLGPTSVCGLIQEGKSIVDWPASIGDSAVVGPLHGKDRQRVELKSTSSS